MSVANLDTVSHRTSGDTVWLVGGGWKDHTSNAYFAMEVIALLVFVGCFVYSFRFTLFKADGKRDRLRTVGYKIACVCSFIAYLIYAIESGLSESRTRTTKYYYIVRLFSALPYCISDILLFAIILRAPVENAVTYVVRGAAGLNFVLTLVIIAINVAFYIMKIISVVYAVGDDKFIRSWLFSTRMVYFSFAFFAVYVGVALFAVVENGMVLARDRSKGSMLMGAVVSPALLIRMVFNLASLLNLYYNPSGLSQGATQLFIAAAFLDLILLAVMFVGIVLAGSFFSKMPAPIPTRKEYDEPN